MASTLSRTWLCVTSRSFQPALSRSSRPILQPEVPAVSTLWPVSKLLLVNNAPPSSSSPNFPARSTGCTTRKCRSIVVEQILLHTIVGHKNVRETMRHRNRRRKHPGRGPSCGDSGFHAGVFKRTVAPVPIEKIGGGRKFGGRTGTVRLPSSAAGLAVARIPLHIGFLGRRRIQEGEIQAVGKLEIENWRGSSERAHTQEIAAIELARHPRKKHSKF
jgi:hypothetical protein